MNILTRFEGGLGDCLLANRFLHAIKEKYPHDNIRVLFDTDGNPKQERVMKELWPNIYTNTYTLPERKDKNYKINTLLGLETYPAHLNNMPQIFNEELKKADKFYDLHIDGLKWLSYDFDWLRYYYYFPKPFHNTTALKEYELPDKFILLHLFARPNSEHNIEQSRAKEIINHLSQFIPTVTICNKEYYDYYKNTNTQLIDPSFVECFDIASKCCVFLGIDSGIRYIPYHYSKPTYVFSKFCIKPGVIHHAQLIRWLLYEKNVLPFNASISDTCHIIKNVLNDPAYCLFPYIKDNIDNYIFNRRI